MRFVRNEVQTPKLIVPPESRQSLPFYFLYFGIVVFALGAIFFFGAYLLRDVIENQMGLPFRDIQTYGLLFAAAGIVLYIIASLLLKISLKKTSYAKLESIIMNEPYDPPRKGDFSKSILLRLRDLSDDWALFSEVKPPEAEYKISQVIVGPGGVFTVYPSNKNASRKSYPDAGPFLKAASAILEKKIGQKVIPIILFPTKKLASIYKEHRDPKTRIMHVMEIEDYFSKRKKKLEKKERDKIEKIVFGWIDGTAPGD